MPRVAFSGDVFDSGQGHLRFPFLLCDRRSQSESSHSLEQDRPFVSTAPTY